MSYQIELQDKSSVEKDLTISIDRNAFNCKYEKELSKISMHAHLKGFRPGKAPKAMVKKVYGSKIYDDVLNQFLNEALKETLSKNDLPVIDTAISNFSQGGEEENDPVKISIVLSLYPEPKVTKYKGLEVEYLVKSFDESEIENRINRLREMFAETKDVGERNIVKTSDIVTIGYVALFDSKVDNNLSAQDQVVELGKEQLPEEIEKEVIGMQIGEPKSIKYTFPESASEELKGKEYTLDVTVVKIQEKILPELNDEFAQKTSLGNDVASLRQSIERQIKSGIESSNNESRDTSILDAVIKENDFELPQVLIDREIRKILAEMRILNPKDKDFDKTPVDTYRHILTDRASERLKRYIVLENLLDEEKIDLSSEEVEKFLDSIAEKEGRSREEVNSELGYPKGMEAIKRMASVSHLFERLQAETKLKEKIAKEVKE